MVTGTETARALRAIPSDRRAEASRANGRKGGRPAPRGRVEIGGEEWTWREIRRHLEVLGCPDRADRKAWRSWLNAARRHFHSGRGESLAFMMGLR